jgi:hypothetical protein
LNKRADRGSLVTIISVTVSASFFHSSFAPTTENKLTSSSTNKKQASSIMEVHHHANHGDKKNWKSYFWEFLMLFLAVTLGFFVENQREHYIEHVRAKDFQKHW